MCWSEGSSTAAALVLVVLALSMFCDAGKVFGAARVRPQPLQNIWRRVSFYMITDALQFFFVGLTQVADMLLWSSTRLGAAPADAAFANTVATRGILLVALTAQPLLAVCMTTLSHHHQRVRTCLRVLCFTVAALTVALILGVNDSRSLPSTDGWMAWGWGGNMTQPLPQVAHDSPVDAALSVRSFVMLWLFCASIALPRLWVAGSSTLSRVLETSARIFAVGGIVTLALAMLVTNTPSSTWCGSGIVTATAIALLDKGLVRAAMAAT